MYKYILNINNQKEELVFETRENVFYPTGTSDLLIDACKLTITSPRKILDLGCGCGLTGIVLAKIGLSEGSLFASDISKNAVDLAKENAARMSVDYDVRCGSLFNPWVGEKFDVIVDDVSGISDDIAEISPWYSHDVTCDAGRDGIRWINRVIEQSRNYLRPGGTFIFPLLSLSNREKILQTLKKTYSSYELILKKDWFLPEEIEAKTDILMSLSRDGSISCQKKFGRWIWSTYIYKANN